MTITKDIKESRRQLKKRILELKSNFSFKQGKDGPTRRQQDKLRGFVLLCHAELESYFENIATLLINNAYNLWLNKKISNYNLTCFLLRYKNKPTKTLKVDSEIFETKKNYINDISNNHGIKGENMHKLFYCLGYNDDDFSVTLISELSSLGVSRGQIAHLSSYKATSLLDKLTIYGQIDRITDELDAFEECILSKL
ncbi:MAG: HEPN domain-containing protein [Christensenellales bacterium]